MSCVVIVGAQWGDEGKGKIVDIYTEFAEVVVRYAGGPNAGHTLVVGDDKLVVRLLPSGILRPQTRCVLAQGMVIDPEVLLGEVDELIRRGHTEVEKRLCVSDRAHLILPYHVLVDTLRESSAGAIGTTKKGIGPAYEDKARRTGVRAGDLRDPARLAERVRAALEAWTPTIRHLGGEVPTAEEILKKLEASTKRIVSLLANTSQIVDTAMREGKRIMLEGAQGTLLDIDHGTYPFVTSSSAVAGGAAIGVGMGPNRISSVLGITKAYATRVGSGPFPTELNDGDGQHLREVGAEFGSVTGRPRRTGWLDLPALRYAARVNGIDGLALTKLDVLTGLVAHLGVRGLRHARGAYRRVPDRLHRRAGRGEAGLRRDGGLEREARRRARARRAAQGGSHLRAVPGRGRQGAGVSGQRRPPPQRNDRAAQPIRRESSRAVNPAWALPLLVVMQTRSAGVSPRPVAWAAQSPRPTACTREPALWEVSRQPLLAKRCQKLALAQALLQRAPAQARERAGVLLVEAPEFAEARVLRGRASLRLGDTAAALGDLAPLLEANAVGLADPSALLDGGRAALSRQDMPKAVSFYRALGGRAALLADRKQQTVAYIEIAAALLAAEQPAYDDVLAYLREARRRSAGSGFTGLAAALNAVAWAAQGREAEAQGALVELTDPDSLTSAKLEQEVWMASGLLHAALGLYLEREHPEASAKHYQALAEGPLARTAVGKLALRTRTRPKRSPG
jgi:adenylosuccinate synthase